MADASSDFDLTRFSESTRRQLYDRIAAIQFAGEGDRHTPDDSGLQEPLWRPVPLRMRIMRIGEGAERGIELYDV